MNATSLIKEFEGCKLEPYQDSGGIWTNGYGNTVGVNPHESITQEQADLDLSRNIKIAIQRIRTYITAPLNQNQLDALTSLVFNLGVAPLKGTLGRLLNARDYHGAAEQFTLWIHCQGKVLQGLVTRRAAEKALFLTSTQGE